MVTNNAKNKNWDWIKISKKEKERGKDQCGLDKYKDHNEELWGENK